MNGTKYVGMDVHTATISVAVLNYEGKLIMESVIEAKGSTIIQFIQGLRGELFLTFEEGTWSAWLYDLLTPYVTRIVVCDPRRNALLREGSESDRIDARKLAELLRADLLRSVYHGENGLRTLKELVRAYLTIGKDLTRVLGKRDTSSLKHVLDLRRRFCNRSGIAGRSLRANSATQPERDNRKQCSATHVSHLELSADG